MGVVVVGFEDRWSQLYSEASVDDVISKVGHVT